MLAAVASVGAFVCRGVILGAKVYTVYDAGKQVKAVYDNPKRSRADVVNATVQVIFVVAQGADLACSIAPDRVKLLAGKVGASAADVVKLQLGANVGAGAADVVRIGTGRYAKNGKLCWSDAVDMGSRLLLRAGDSVQLMGKLDSELAGHVFKLQDPKAIEAKVKEVSEGLMALGSIPSLVRRAKRPTPPPDPEPQQQQPQPQPANQPNNRRVEAEQKRDAAIEGNLKEAGGKELDEQEVKFNLDYQAYLADPLACERIPEAISSNKQLQLYKCAITGKPVRHPVVPEFPPEIERLDKWKRFCYERETLEQFIRENPDKLPPGWPVEHVPRLNFKLNLFMKRSIEDVLESFAAAIKEDMPNQ